LPGRRGPRARRADKLKGAYGKLLASTSRVVGQAKRFAKEIADGVKRARDLMGQLALDALRQEIDEMLPAGPAGDEANPRAHPSRRYSRRRQDCQLASRNVGSRATVSALALIGLRPPVGSSHQYGINPHRSGSSRRLAGLMIATDDEELLAGRAVPARRVIAHPAVSHIHALHEDG
jgi:hypothetical protein